MKEISGKINLNSLSIKPHNIIFAYTTTRDYEMQRYILLEDLEITFDDGTAMDRYDEFLLLEGGHCSCYDFDETSWDGTIYTGKELIALADANYNSDNPFWNMVKQYGF